MKLLEYIDQNLASFDDLPFTPLDSAALASFCMVRSDLLVPPLESRLSFASDKMLVKNIEAHTTKPAHFIDFVRAELYPSLFVGLEPAKAKQLMLALAASPRYRNMNVQDALDLFDVERQTQFFAVTYIEPGKFVYLGFRGTDATFTGWRENFNMVFSDAVPSQLQALRYLEAIAKEVPEKIYLGGHSKGGNLAAYAALHAPCEIQDRIAGVYLHDAPGFTTDTVDPSRWKSLAGRIHRSVPQESFVGMLMDTPVPYHVVQSDGVGIMQHSPFTWEIDETTNDFVYLEALQDSALYNASVFDVWISQYSRQEAAEIVDALFEAIEVSGARDAKDVLFAGPHSIGLITSTARHLDSASRTTLLNALGSLANIAGAGIGPELAGRITHTHKNS
ncbi:Mbeg1-like protein [Eggerthellaceae bacterium 3-80]|nr:DUF2974 domain-containing protein [bacterium D16-34]